MIAAVGFASACAHVRGPKEIQQSWVVQDVVTADGDRDFARLGLLTNGDGGSAILYLVVVGGVRALMLAHRPAEDWRIEMALAESVGELCHAEYDIRGHARVSFAGFTHLDGAGWQPRDKHVLWDGQHNQAVPAQACTPQGGQSWFKRNDHLHTFSVTEQGLIEHRVRAQAPGTDISLSQVCPPFPVSDGYTVRSDGIGVLEGSAGKLYVVTHEQALAKPSQGRLRMAVCDQMEWSIGTVAATVGATNFRLHQDARGHISLAFADHPDRSSRLRLANLHARAVPLDGQTQVSDPRLAPALEACERAIRTDFGWHEPQRTFNHGDFLRCNYILERGLAPAAKAVWQERCEVEGSATACELHAGLDFYLFARSSHQLGLVVNGQTVSASGFRGGPKAVGGPENLARAADYFKRACALGGGFHTCDNYVMLSKRLGGSFCAAAKDECRAGAPVSCALVLECAPPPVGQRAAIEATLGTACESGELPSCNNLAVSQFSAESAQQHYPALRATFARLCEAGLETACHNLEVVKDASSQP